MNIVVNFIKDILKNAYELDQGREVLLAVVEKNFPQYDKRVLEEIDLYLLRHEFEQWLRDEFRKEPVPYAVKSLWFGLVTLYESQRPKVEQEITVLHLTGSDLTPAADENWASKVIYHPKSRYADLEAYRKLSISVNAFKQEAEWKVYNDLESIIFLGVSYLIIKNTLEPISSLVIGEAGGTFVGFGYDSGDSWMIGRLTEKGLKKK